MQRKVKSEGIQKPNTAIQRSIARPPSGPGVMLANIFNRSLRRQNWPWIGAGILGVAILAGLSFLAFSDFLWSAKKPDPLKQQVEEDQTPPRLNANTAPGPAPEGMVWVPGGEFYMGIDPEAFPDLPPGFFIDAWPVRKVYVDAFWMDKNEVMNEQFAVFVKETGFKTHVEKAPDPKDFPTVPKEDLIPFSSVFDGTKKNPGMQEWWWHFGPGACWYRPEGERSNITGRERHPVVQITYDDALKFCEWRSKKEGRTFRLPTEAEWEFAARGGLDRKPFCWGNEQNPDGKYLANYFQGAFPFGDSGKDGFKGTAPVGSYPANGYGLHDMAGNVWEWCSDWYMADHYREASNRNPKGPPFGVDLREQGVPKRVQRGGSFLCSDNYCMRYLPAARGKGEPTSANPHVGFRCVMEAK